MTAPPSVGWTRATFTGWSLGFAFVLLIIAATSAVGLGDTQFPIGLGIGLGVGLLQGRRVEALGIARRDWAAATTLGMALPFIAHDVASAMVPRMPYSLAVLVLAGGVLTGVLQWRLLPRTPGRALWIPSSVVAWGLAGSTALFDYRWLAGIAGVVGALMYIAVILAGGIALGVVGAFSLHRVLPRTARAGGFATD